MSKSTLHALSQPEPEHDLLHESLRNGARKLIPWLYLRGVSSGDFQEALSAMVGDQAKGLSANTVSRLKGRWQEEHKAWQRRDLSQKRYVYWWADGATATCAWTTSCAY